MGLTQCTNALLTLRESHLFYVFYVCAWLRMSTHGIQVYRYMYCECGGQGVRPYLGQGFSLTYNFLRRPGQ